MREPAIPMDELRRPYAALGVIEEMMGEQSSLGRCSTFEGLLDYGPLLTAKSIDLSIMHIRE